MKTFIESNSYFAENNEEIIIKTKINDYRGDHYIANTTNIIEILSISTNYMTIDFTKMTQHQIDESITFICQLFKMSFVDFLNMINDSHCDNNPPVDDTRIFTPEWSHEKMSDLWY